jgi:aldehyde:ferredoxin oxidoreductase
VKKMTEWYGWAGTILRVDLDKKKITKQPLSKELALGFLGGRGFNMKVLWDEVKPGLDPLSPGNVLSIGVGPLNGTIFPCSGRYNVSYKSPWTGILGDGNAGGKLAAALKQAGYDQIIVTGRSDKPVYLWINDEEVELKDAGHLWGQSTWETNEAIIKDDGATSVCCIGPAGENLVRTSCLITDAFDAHGMCGPGAVFGSKNLKAVAVKGTKGVRVADPERFLELTKRVVDKKVNGGPVPGETGYREYDIGALRGTPSIVDYMKRDNWDWVRYATTAIFKSYDNFTSDVLLKNTVKLRGCCVCPTHCKRYYEVQEGRYKGLRGGGVEYNVVKYNCVVNDLKEYGEALNLNNLYNQLGLTVNHGTTIAYAIYLYKKGFITEEQADGLRLDWGDAELVAELARRTAYREGFLGNLLAEGHYNMGRILGPEALWHCIHVLGLASFPDFRGKNFMMIQRCTSTRGCDHLRGEVGGGHIGYWAHILKDPMIADRFSTYGKPIATINSQNVQALFDSYSICKNGLYPFYGEEAAEVLSALTGISFTGEMLWKIGERIYNLEQSINVREGVKRKHMVPPPRYYHEPQADGLGKGTISKKEDYVEMMDNYLKMRGWKTTTAIPLRTKLEELGLGNVADELEEGIPFREWEGPPLNK